MSPGPGRLSILRRRDPIPQVMPYRRNGRRPFGQRFYYPSHRLVPGCLRAFVDVLKEVERSSNRDGRGMTMATKN
jgi:hypothetical protein